MDSCFVLIENQNFAVEEAQILGLTKATPVIDYLENDRAPVAIIKNHLKKPVLVTALGYEGHCLRKTGLADAVFAIDIGSLDEEDPAKIVKKIAKGDWTYIKDKFEISSPKVSFTSELIGAPFWGKSTLELKPGKYKVGYSIYSGDEEQPLYIFVRLDLEE
ncbi:MAG TPA: hypothetical protein VN132_07450 [Bdellovibrio sp.]|nr:hypothetical protein [Bdellovibrio sp.]